MFYLSQLKKNKKLGIKSPIIGFSILQPIYSNIGPTILKSIT